MDIEQLSKSQIVLLTLLVSFVTSIATGIVTVSLMEQAPPIVAQTVNRIVEHTVETVVPAASGQAAATVVTQEKTIVVHESEQISKAVEKIAPSLVRLYASEADDALFLGLGIVMDASGMIIADTAAVSSLNSAFVALPDGSRVPSTVTARNTAAGVVFLAATSTEAVQPTWVPAKFAAANPILGQSIVTLSGRTASRVAQGIVAALMAEATVIDTDIASGSITSGSPLLNLDGAVVGVSTGASRASSQSGYLSSSVILSLER